MTRSKKLLWALAAVTLIAGILVWSQIWIILFFASPKMMILADPNHNGRVFLLAQGAQGGYIVNLYVPLSNSDTRVKRIVVLEFQEFEATWSADGSVLAFESNDHYVFAYDFKSGQAIPSGVSSLSNWPNQVSSEDSERIKTLIQERGFPKYRIPCSVSRTFIPMNYSGWRKFRSVVGVGE